MRLDDLKIKEMQELLIENNIDINDIVVHAPYIVNLAQGDREKHDFAIRFITQEVEYAHEAGFKTIVLHPGAHVGQGVETGIKNIANALIQILDNTKHTDVNIPIETMAGKGAVGSNFYEYKNYQTCRLKSHQVCFDTVILLIRI